MTWSTIAPIASMPEAMTNTSPLAPCGVAAAQVDDRQRIAAQLEQAADRRGHAGQDVEPVEPNDLTNLVEPAREVPVAETEHDVADHRASLVLNLADLLAFAVRSAWVASRRQRSTSSAALRPPKNADTSSAGKSPTVAAAAR